MFNFLFNRRYSQRRICFEDNFEPQDIFLDNLSRKKEEELGISERKLEIPLPGWAIKSFGLVLFMMLFILLGRSFQMQVIDGATYQSLAYRNKSIIEPARVLRGVIYDKNGQQLVYNSVTFDLSLSKRNFPINNANLVKKIAEIIDIEESELKEKIKKIEGRGVIAYNIDHETAIMLTVKENEFPGISVERTIERNYKNGHNFAHILGYTGEVTREDIANNPERYTMHDHLGKAGIERYYEESLARERGTFRIETDVIGNLIKREEVNPVLPGNNLSLWIDEDLQNKITEITKAVLTEIGSSKASVIAMNPKTGGILSMVSIPEYDNNVFSRTGDKDLLNSFLIDKDGVFINRPVEALYPTGSTIKPLLAAAALEENIISADKKIYSPGYLEIPNPWNPDNPTRMLDFQAHGWTNIKEAIAVSSNVYFYTIGGGHKDQKGLGINKIKEYLENFGWGEITGIDLPNEKRGTIPDPEWKSKRYQETWTLGDTYNSSIGQGYVLTTPLQVAVSYSALVNGGKVIKPQIVKEIHENETTIKIEPEILKENFISPENLEIVKEGMHLTTKIGTAQRLGWLSEKVGAKTGTSQIPKPGHYHNWIAVFGPYEDPEIVLVVLIEEVEGIRASASLIAYEVLDWYFNHESENKNQTQ